MKKNALILSILIVAAIVGAYINSIYCERAAIISHKKWSNECYKETSRHLSYIRNAILLGGPEIFEELVRIIPSGEPMELRDCLLIAREKNSKWRKLFDTTDKLFKFEGNTNMADGFGVGLRIKHHNYNLIIWSHGENRQDNASKFDDVGLLIRKTKNSLVFEDLGTPLDHAAAAEPSLQRSDI